MNKNDLELIIKVRNDITELNKKHFFGDGSLRQEIHLNANDSFDVNDKLVEMRNLLDSLIHKSS